MKESDIVRAIQRAVEKTYPVPCCWVRKISDRSTRGMPDLLIVWSVHRTSAHVLLVEVKRPGEKPNALQELEAKRVNDIGIPWIVADCPEDVLEIMKIMEE